MIGVGEHLVVRALGALIVGGTGPPVGRPPVDDAAGHVLGHVGQQQEVVGGGGVDIQFRGFVLDSEVVEVHIVAAGADDPEVPVAELDRLGGGGGDVGGVAVRVVHLGQNVLLGA